MKKLNNKRKAYWTKKTHIFKKDEYICSGCHYIADKPCKNCPSCRSKMNGSNYDPNWVDEIEMIDSLL